MADNRNTYTIKEDGGISSVKIADEVVAVIAGLAATEVKGVASIEGGITNSMVARKGIKALSRGVKVAIRENVCTVDLVLSLEYGYSIPEIGSEVQEKVKTAIETMTGMEVTDVNIRVSEIAVKEED